MREGGERLLFVEAGRANDGHPRSARPTKACSGRRCAPPLMLSV